MNTLHNMQQLAEIEEVMGELMWLWKFVEQPNRVLLIHKTVLESDEYLDMIFERIKEA